MPPSFWRFNGFGAKKKAASNLTPKAGAVSDRIAIIPWQIYAPVARAETVKNEK
ncbi:MAG: hypothetical protein NTX50_25340 [Candidatus Sumerlaeota bacterium]|nr:hypothetical protein [Candidatus Sumerlaeota bacterium]